MLRKILSRLAESDRNRKAAAAGLGVVVESPSHSRFHPGDRVVFFAPNHSANHGSKPSEVGIAAVRWCSMIAERNKLTKNTVLLLKSTQSNLPLDVLQIKSGEWVVIKPNLVKEHAENDPHHWESVVTSPALIRAVAKFVAERVGSGGRVTICDGPQTDSSFSEITKLLDTRFLEKLERTTGAACELIDLRDQEWKNEGGVIIRRKKLNGDPNGRVRFDLGRKSLFYGHPGEGRYYGADYESREVNSHHHGDIHEYLIAATPIKCDVFINMPKLKTHKKTGVTLSLKSLVGINADKNWLPHYTEGSPSFGGDQFSDDTFKHRFERVAVRAARKVMLKFPNSGPKLMRRLRPTGNSILGATSDVIRSGNWYGNNTTWRMALDLNRCLLFGNEDGTFRPESQSKRYYSIVDGIIGMQGAGPMQGDPVDVGVVLIGSDPVAVDMVAARLMGFDWRKIPIIREAFDLKEMAITTLSPVDVVTVSNRRQWNGNFLADVSPRDVFWQFEPHFGWKNYIEFLNES